MQATNRIYYDEVGNLVIKPCRISDLAGIYGVSCRTMRRWIKNAVPEAKRNGTQFYLVTSIQTIIDVIGPPKKPTNKTV